MLKNKTAILLLNIGSPEELTLSSVRKYLRRFLMDPYVIQIPFLLRYILFYLLICNIRAPRTLLKYQSIWRPEGSPFHFFTENLRRALENTLKIRVMNLMMYSEPGFQRAFTELKSENFSKIIVCPMYPQYAASSTASSLNKFRDYFSESGLNSELIFVEPFFQQNFFIESFYNNIKTSFPDYASFDHVVFSYHGLPETHIKNSRPEQNYREQCIKTTELLATKLGLEPKKYVTCFQSRVGVTKWISPYLDQTCEELAVSGKTKLLVVSPSFVVDGLETLQEISDLERDLQRRYKISISLVKGLNSEGFWIENFASFLRQLANETKK